MHLTLEKMNRILDGSAKDSERFEVAEHLIECSKCRRQYQMFHELHQETPANKKSSRISWLAVAGIAAALFLTGILFQFSENKHHEEFQTVKIQQAGLSPETFNLLQEVEKVNKESRLPDWGKKTNVCDLLKSS